MEKISSNKFIAGGRSSTTKDAVDRLLEKVNRGAGPQSAMAATSNLVTTVGSVFKVSVGKVEIPQGPSPQKR